MTTHLTAALELAIHAIAFARALREAGEVAIDEALVVVRELDAFGTAVPGLNDLCRQARRTLTDRRNQIHLDRDLAAAPAVSQP